MTPFGVGVESLWDGLLAGETRLERITRFDPSGFPCRLAGEVRNFSAKDHVPRHYRKAVKVMARDIELAVVAAKCAVEDARLSTKGCPRDGNDQNDSAHERGDGLAGDPPTYAPRRVGCHIGAGLIAAELDELTAALATAVDERAEFSLTRWGDAEGGGGAMGNLPPLWLLKYLPNMLACHVTILHDAQGPSNTITCAEASGLLSIGESVRVIERDDADLCFSGSAENKVTPMGLLRMDFARRLAHTGDEADSHDGPDAHPTDGFSPTDGSRFVRPFDPDAPGGLLGEAGGIVMLELERTARAREARIYANISGFGAGHAPRSDDPVERSRGLRHAIERAIANAGITSAEIDAILPHASGAVACDAEEAAALRSVFGDRLGEIPLITLTPSLGDTMAGFGSVAVCVAAKCLHHQTLPARRHAGRCVPGLNAGPAQTRDAKLRHVLVCTNSLGGQNAAVVLSAA